MICVGEPREGHQNPTKGRFTFAKKHFDDVQDFLDNILQTEEIKVKVFERFAAHLDNLL